jgi:hypothetical protein
LSPYPLPGSFISPNGAASVKAIPSLIPIMPHFSAAATQQIRSISRELKYGASLNAVSLARFLASGQHDFGNTFQNYWLKEGSPGKMLLTYSQNLNSYA